MAEKCFATIQCYLLDHCKKLAVAADGEFFTFLTNSIIIGYYEFEKGTIQKMGSFLTPFFNASIFKFLLETPRIEILL